MSDKKNSRKWKLVLLILLVATVGTFIPPVVSAWIFKNPDPLYILTGANFVTLITLIVSAYFGANVLQKHVLKNTNTSEENSINTQVKQNDDEGEA